MKVWTDAAIERAVLIDPIRDGCTELRALSGYASPSIAYSLLAREGADAVEVHLTVGMVVADGISLGAHRGFIALQKVDYPGRVRVGYVVSGKPVHSKVYVWSRGGVPHRAFIGSANFTSNGLQGGYREILAEADPVASLAHVNLVAAAALACDSPDVPNNLVVLSTRRPRRDGGVLPQYHPWKADNAPYVDISLLNKRTGTGVAYGLNWGHRPGRDRDQSYLPVPAVVARTGFLPPRGRRFTLLAATGHALSAVVAQDGDKAIETPDSNAIMGRFIRAQLGLPNGSLVEAKDLRRANATGFRLYRVDAETYAIEFGPYG
ncbi:MAG: NgoFVII family restriction endonuclease [Gemmatimonadetes bacterium]|nr:NgoFVII family restriction endonuclease [Gemmatimonadota bacterium]